MPSAIRTRMWPLAVAACFLGGFAPFRANAQFLDAFNDSTFAVDSQGVSGWTSITGDGRATMTFTPSGNGYASICVDATRDTRGIWWALIRRRVSEHMDLSLLRSHRCALRIEARIRVSHAPRRVNLHLNTQRTTDFHSHLMEFDIADTSNWHTISMTTRNFDAVPGDSVYGQLALMDWGLQRYRVDVDFFRVDIVDTTMAGPDKGVQVPYHPPAPPVELLRHHVRAATDAVVNAEYPEMNFGAWSVEEAAGRVMVLTVTGPQCAILRWDLTPFKGAKVTGPGVLELTTHSLLRSPDYVKDFGMVRVTEITGGNPVWVRSDVTFAALCRGAAVDDVMNPQMIVDTDVLAQRGSRNQILISRPVLQRLIDGRTYGLALRPLGAVVASFFASENPDSTIRPTLHFNAAR